MPDLPRSSTRVARVDLWGRPLGWLVVIAGGALALRLVGLDHVNNGAITRVIVLSSLIKTWRLGPAVSL